MKSTLILGVALLMGTHLCHAQQPAPLAKLSPSLKRVATRQQAPLSDQRILTLLTFSHRDQSSALLAGYGCRVIDSIGRIFIVDVPCRKLSALSADQRIERIEAEPMPRPAMDVTPGQIDATPVYAGEGLPQAFTGQGVAAGVFDNGYDFTHPAFLNDEGQSRAQYYYDFCWKNDDGTKGHAMTSPEEIAAYGHTHHANITLHGTHVLGIMAGRPVDGKYPGMAPEADLYLAHFNSYEEDFDAPDALTSATCVLGFKYLFDQAAKDGKPCVVNFSSGESYTLGHRHLLEAEALQSLIGPGRIIVACAGNDGHHTAYMEKPADILQAGTAIVNGIGGGQTIDLDIVTPVDQQVRLDFLSIRLMDTHIEKTLSFRTDSVLALNDTCRLSTTVTLGDIHLKIWKSDYQDPRGDVLHLHGDMPNLAYLMLCGALFLLTGDGPAWVYSDIKYCPFSNIDNIPAYAYALPGYSTWWPGTMPGIITVGATGYKSTFKNIDGETNDGVVSLAAAQTGQIARFSSQGPTFDGLTKPDVVAPGVSINAPFNSYVEMTSTIRKALTDKVTYQGKTFYYTAQSGTSMASPVVAGAIALWLQAKPDLTPDDILDVFAHTCTHPDETMDYPNSTYGYGQIDVYRGLLYILQMNEKVTGLSDHQPASARFVLRGRRLSVESDTPLPPASTLTVYALSGAVVASCQGSTLDLSACPSGVYAVQLNTGQQTTSGSTLIRL